MKGKSVFVVVLIVLVLCVCITPFAHDFAMKLVYPVVYEDIIAKFSKNYDLDPYLVLGLVKAESNFMNDARSNKGARGLMQITDNTAMWAAKKMNLNNFDVSDLDIPSVNVSIGCWYLKYLLDEYDGDIKLALCAYNAGIGNVSKWLADEKYSQDGKTLYEIPFSETKHYVANTQKYWEKYKTLYPEIFN